MTAHPTRADFPSPRLTRRRAVALLGLGSAGIALTACTSSADRPADTGAISTTPAQDFSARFAAFKVADEPNGDPAKVTWPDWISQADPEVKRLYEFQILNGDLMRWMPCFCGCGKSSDHRNNRDCYVQAVNPDGSVEFDRMAPT